VALLVDPETERILDVEQAAVELSVRESHILYMLVCGETVKEMAYVVGIRPATVRAHLKHLRQGLNIHTQALLTRWAMSHRQAAVAGTAVGIRQHRKNCPCSEPFCTYARVGMHVVALTSAQTRALLKAPKPKRS
jgi:DNA-binding CsgD family transcriptional regulator